MAAVGAVAVAALVLGVAWLQTRDEGKPAGGAAADPGPVHIHGLGINPADQSLFIATHTGMYRVEDGETTPERVGDRRQDTMGFTVVGADHFLGSGHPDLRDVQEKGWPSHLGLIESTDAGKTWEPVSLLGEADFHVLRAAGRRVVGFDVTNERLLVSRDGGRTWQERDEPGALIDLAVNPTDTDQVVASTETALYASSNEGRTWRPAAQAVGLLAWPPGKNLYLVTGEGQIFASGDSGRRWRQAGEVGGEPAAFTSAADGRLYVALHDGTVKVSGDGGRTWSLRSRGETSS